RGAPEALAGEQPVTQPVVGRLMAGALFGQEFDGLVDGFLSCKTVEGSGVDVVAGLCGGNAGILRVIFTGVDYDPDGQIHGTGEVHVSLVMCWHSHDRTRPVV